MCLCMKVECCLLSEAALSARKECGTLFEFVLGTNSHFISCGTDHHTSVTTHSVLSAAAQTCHFHLYSSILHEYLKRFDRTLFDTDLVLSPGFDGHTTVSSVKDMRERDVNKGHLHRNAVKINISICAKSETLGCNVFKNVQGLILVQVFFYCVSSTHASAFPVEVAIIM